MIVDEQLEKYENEKIALISRICDLEGEIKESRLVLDVLDTAKPCRQCFRMVGSVLIPQTVDELKIILSDNIEKISDVLNKLNKNFENTSKKHDEALANLQVDLQKRVDSDVNKC